MLWIDIDLARLQRPKRHRTFLKPSRSKRPLPFALQICSLLRGGIAERGGVRVGHRIIEINGHSVVATPHERIVSMLSHSVGEVRHRASLVVDLYCRVVSASNEDYADPDVSSFNGSRNAHLYLIVDFSCSHSKS
jgi:hypothetical protein